MCHNYVAAVPIKHMAETQEKYPESVGASVSEDLKRRIRIAAAKEDVSMSTYVREILEEYADENDL